MVNAVFEYEQFNAKIEQFAAELPGLLAGHHVTADLVRRVKGLTASVESPFTVAVVGQMRSGKSSLLNALVGSDLAVTGVSETTATINWFKYGDADRKGCCRVVWKDRPAEDVSIDEVRRHWIGDSERAKATRYLEFYDDRDFLKYANIVDTPGTRSVIEAHEETIRTFLSAKLDRESRREGESADAIIYVLPVVARETDKSMLTEFESENRLPGSSPYNSLAVVHKWETLQVDDPYAEAAKKVEHIAGALKGLVSVVIPVSAPLAKAAERVGAETWARLFEFAGKSGADVIDDLLMDEGEFKTYDHPKCRHSPVDREAILTMFDVPWPSFKVIVQTALRNKSSTPEEFRLLVHEMSGMEQLRSHLERQFFSCSRMIKAFSVLNKALEPCRIATTRLRNHKNRFQALLEDAHASTAVLADGEGEAIDLLREYVNQTRGLVENDLDESRKLLERLGRIIVEIQDAHGPMDADLEMRELVDRHALELGAERSEHFRFLFGASGTSVERRISFLRTSSASDALLPLDDLMTTLRRVAAGQKGEVRRVFEHAVLRLEQLIDAIERSIQGAIG